jgi:hypothetical protein
MSQLEVDKVIPQSGTTLTLGDSADTITIPSGATLDASNATLTLPDDSVTTAKIDDGAVTNAKVDASAAIATTKLGAGAVLQVVSATDATGRSTASTTYVTASNTLTVSITPSSVSNKVLVFGHSTLNIVGANKLTYLTVYRDATNIASTNGFANQFSADGGEYSSNGFSFLDSPSSTSALTYQVYIKAESGGTAIMNANATTSAITVMEIAG